MITKALKNKSIELSTCFLLLGLMLAAKPKDLVAAETDQIAPTQVQTSEGSILKEPLLSRPEEKTIYLGKCTLNTDPKFVPPQNLMHLCAKGSSGAGLFFDSHYPNSQSTLYAQSYFGLHMTEYVSLHLKGSLHYAQPLSTDFESTTTYDPRLAVIQLGNSAIHPFRATVGYQNLPLGINFNPFQTYLNPEFNRNLWETSKTSAVFTWDNQFDVQANIGVTSSQKIIEDKNNSNSEEAKSAVSLQALLDVSSLDGTRFALSTYASEQGERKLGIGILNVSRKGEKTSIEWLRQRKDPRGKRFSFEQIIRISFQGAFKRKARTNFLFDHIRNSHRIGMLGQDYQASENLLVNGHISYLASDSAEYIDAWTWAMGVSAKL